MITPMKRLHTNFRTLRMLLTGFEYYTLNKSSSKSIPYPFEPKDRLTGKYKSYTKGVKNDFVLNFNKIDTDLSIGFIINYLEDYDDPTFVVTIKFGGSNEYIQASDEMNMDDFRGKLNYLNKKLKENNNNPVETISLIFLDEKYDLEKYNQKAEAEVMGLIGEDYEKYSDLKSELNENVKTLDKANEELNLQLSKLEEFKKVQDLEKALAEAKNELSKKRNELESVTKISELELSINKQENMVLKVGWKLTSKLSKLKGKFPRFVSDKIKEIVDLRFKLNGVIEKNK